MCSVARHQLQSLNRNHHLTLINHPVISGIQRRSPASGSMMTLLSTPERVAVIHGRRPSQAKSLSLGEYVLLTDVTFTFTRSFQSSVLILFHCTIHASIISFSSFLLVCLINPKKNQKKLFSLISMLVVVVIKRKPKKISRFSFACWKLSCVNSFISFLSFGSREEKTLNENVQWL